MFPLFTVSISMWIVQQPSSSTYILYKSVSFNVHPSFCMVFHNLFLSWSQFFSWALFFQFHIQAFVGILSWFVLFMLTTFPYYFILLFITLISKIFIFKNILLLLVLLFSFPSLHPTKSYFSCYYFIISMRVGSAFSRISFVRAE